MQQGLLICRLIKWERVAAGARRVICAFWQLAEDHSSLVLLAVRLLPGHCASSCPLLTISLTLTAQLQTLMACPLALPQKDSFAAPSPAPKVTPIRLSLMPQEEASLRAEVERL